jgi:thiamine biosynthesis protein ThiS
MYVVVNGEPKELQPHQNQLMHALTALGYTLDMPMAIAVNRKIIARQNFSEVTLSANDEIEILVPMQGG